MIHLISSFHYDVIYLKASEPYRKTGFEIIDRALELLVQEPDYRFNVEQVILLEAYWNAHPDKHALMRELAAAGRLVSAPGMYVMPDLNLIDGESLCRQVKLGRRWLREHLGIVPDACWIADCWGHHAQLPQILTRCGYRSYFFWRCMRPEVMRNNFRWRGIDGSEILAHWLAYGYSGIHFNGSGKVSNALEQRFFGVTPEELNRRCDNLRKFGDDGVFLIPNGGDFCYPQPDGPEAVRELNRSGATPPLEFSTPSRYSAAVDRSELPLVEGEFNGAFQGTYTTNIWIKQRVERARARLMTLERLAALSGTSPDFEPLWRIVLKAQFHDTICGTITDAGLEETEAELNELERALDSFYGGTPDRLFNPIAATRTAPVELPDGRRIMVTMKPLETLSLAELPLTEPEESRPLPLPAAFQNRFFRMEFDADGTPVSLRIPSGAELIRSGSAGFGDLTMQYDGGDNWLNFEAPLDGGSFEAALTHNVPDPLRREPRTLLNRQTFFPVNRSASAEVRGKECIVIRQGELVFWTIRVPFVTEYRFHEDSPLIRCRTTITPAGRHYRIRAAFPTAVSNGRVRHGIPFGVMERPRAELPASGWFDFRNDTAGISILLRGIYGANVDEEDIMLVTLFRSAAMEYKTASEGSFNIGRTHSFEYAILPHSGGDDLRTSAAAAEEWLFPPLLGRFPAPSCRLPGWELPPGTILSTLKPADDGNGWFVRIVETAGAPAEFDLPLPPGTRCVAASALEEPQGDFAEMSSLHLSLRPFQLHSFLLSFREKRK